MVDARGHQEPARDRRPDRPLSRLAAVGLAAGLLALAACGGSAERGPRLPRALAQSLAARADAVADAPDGCAARRALGRLRTAVVAAVNAHRVPSAFQEELLAAVNRLSAPACARASTR